MLNQDDLAKLNASVEELKTGGDDKKTEEAIETLRKIINVAQSILASMTQARRAALQAELAELEAMTGTGGQPAKKPAGAPKYRNPDNHTETWTGRGRLPKWAQEARSAGTLESYRIPA